MFVLLLTYLFKGGKIQQLEWDVSTVTAGDYTLEFDIPASAYHNWYNRVYKAPGGEFEQGYSPALSLKRHMIEKIESVLEGKIRRLVGSGSTMS